ncbi:MAG: phosphoribosyltransferase [Bryobacterales bacterium]|nr:phosphoribosyltransferase [Bryobacterales bacterium]
MTELIPTQQEVVAALRKSGAWRPGHFRLSTGIHTDHYLQVSLAMRDARLSKTLSVSLSRKLRTDTEIRASLSSLSLIAASTSGLPIAYGISEAIQARQVYWGEKEGEQPMRFRPYLEQSRGEKVVIVDDVYRSGARINELREKCDKNGAEVVAIATLVYQPTPSTPVIRDLPFFYLAKLNAQYYADTESCELCRRGVPLEVPWM